MSTEGKGNTFELLEMMVVSPRDSLDVAEEADSGVRLETVTELTQEEQKQERPWRIELALQHLASM